MGKVETSVTLQNPVENKARITQRGEGHEKFTELHWNKEDFQGNVTLKMNFEKKEIVGTTTLASLEHFT